MLNNNQIRLCALLLSFTCVTFAAQLPASFRQATRTQYYQYPVPRQQFVLPAIKPTAQQQFQRQQPQYQQQQYTSYPQVYEQNYHHHQQQQQQQQQYSRQNQQTVNSYYQQSTFNNNKNNNNNIIKKFASPALENAAFTTALRSQGYSFGDIGRGISGINSPTKVPVGSARALPVDVAHNGRNNDIGRGDGGNIDLTDSSINLELPLPVNVAPIKVSPLPLEQGVSFRELANGVTSYGTVYPQRRRL